MNGVHDMGGMDGFGRIEPERDEPVFHAPWEGRVMAMMRAMGCVGGWNLDMFRNARESQPPSFYLTASYYKSWEKTLETLLLERGLVMEEEIVASRSFSGSTVAGQPLRAEDVSKALKRQSYERSTSAAALFKVGDGVRTRNIHLPTHTRLPRYARGRRGTIERVHGCHVFPDSSAVGAGDDPQWLYTVVFDGSELWGTDDDPSLKVSVEAFEPYLEAL
ncbi:nitrile hydratase subunit beta [Kaistia terrae]|uniref:Nitrile hydratase subunit beta n=1 Tax=Kaistia terrae TaxID=537017 RepID=A0ABW0Q2C9_9HYPH|nr:nitrile hydratase subunit beta [Kaistia terrae]MCX5581544.1 nitrile hydratase subunit beta [Kaistia terrae]